MYTTTEALVPEAGEEKEVYVAATDLFPEATGGAAGKRQGVDGGKRQRPHKPVYVDR